MLLPTDIDLAASVATFDHYSGYTQIFNGLRMWKTAEDLARYAAVIERDRPELLIETGTRWAGFATWAAVTYDLKVITIDIAPVYSPPLDPRIIALHADSAAEETAIRVQAFDPRGELRTMVVLDSDHHAGHVAREVELYAGFVSSGCTLIVEDTIADYAGGNLARRIGNRIPEDGGPMAGVTLLVDDPRFERDLEIENMSAVSHHPAGWWRRAA